MRMFFVPCILAITSVLILPVFAQIDGLANLPSCAVRLLSPDLIIK
jgi:hypothetical protein